MNHSFQWIGWSVHKTGFNDSFTKWTNQFLKLTESEIHPPYYFILWNIFKYLFCQDSALKDRHTHNFYHFSFLQRVGYENVLVVCVL